MNADIVTPKGFFDSLKSLFVPEHHTEEKPEDTAHEKDWAYVDGADGTSYETETMPDDYAGDAIPPIPVKIITEKPAVDIPKGASWFTSVHHQLRTAANTQQGGATLIASRDSRRRKVIIINRGHSANTDYIVIGTTSNLSITAQSSGRIFPGDPWLELDTTSDVYAMPSVDVTDIEVFQLFEYGGGD